MFEIQVCDARQIVLVRFRGGVTEKDLAALDALAGQQQSSSGFDTVIDFTGVEQPILSTEVISKRGELSQPFKNREGVYVVQHPDLKLLIRLFVAYQEAKGWRPPVVVDTLAKAMARLHVTTADFRPVALPPRARE